MKEIRKLLQKLGKTQRNFFIWYLRILKAHSSFMRAPRLLRFGFAHAGVTFGTLMYVPPAHEIQPIALAVIISGSFAITYILMAIFKL